MNRMKKLIIAALLVLSWTSVSADHFNSDNIIEECAEDTSFNSKCYTYIAAYGDILIHYLRASEDDKTRLLCLLSLDTRKIVKRLSTIDEPVSDQRVPMLIIDEFCN
jgi:hypothetical protein